MTTDSELDELDAMLPFHVTGRLAGAEAIRAENFAAISPERLALILEEKQAIAAGYEDIVRPASDFSRIAPRLAARGEQTAGRFRRILLGVRKFFACPEPAMLRWAAVAAAAVVVAQAGVIGTLVTANAPNQFKTASGGRTIHQDGTFVILRFVDGATSSVIADTLAGLGMNIVDGPAAGGLFTVRAGPGAMTEAERDHAVASLRQRTDVVAFVTLLR